MAVPFQSVHSPEVHSDCQEDIHFPWTAGGGYAPVRAIRMPNFRIRNWRVERFMPSRAAAPLGPAMTHCNCSRALRIWLRSASPSVSRSVFAGLTGFASAARAVWASSLSR